MSRRQFQRYEDELFKGLARREAARPRRDGPPAPRKSGPPRLAGLVRDELLATLRTPDLGEGTVLGWAGGMYMRGGELEAIGADLLDGHGVRETARKFGCSKYRTAKVKRHLNAARKLRGLGPIECPCGLPSGHRGWCEHRYRKSPRRQRALASVHRRQWAGGAA